ncbi:MAG: hypothetical protein IPM52_10635 [Bacteroidetes bacterium]|nr:hypothetical protein [Bacteroidota bacterium]
MPALQPTAGYLPLNLMELIPWVIVGLLLFIALMLFFFLVVHRRNNLRRFAELEEKMLFFHPAGLPDKPESMDMAYVLAELERIKAQLAELRAMQTSPKADEVTMEKIEIFKKGIHQHLNELYERIKLNEINTNRMLHYLEDLRESISQAGE